MKKYLLRNKKSSGKEVKIMKKLCSLAVITLLLITTNPAFAVDATNVNPTQTIRINTTYSLNQYGVIIGSTTTVTISGIDEQGRNFTTTQVTYSSWKGGGLSVDKVTTTTRTWASNGYDVTTTSTTNYTYDSNGRLTGGNGTVTMKGSLEDNQGTINGTVTNNYIVSNGQLLVASSTSTQNITVGGQLSQTITDTTTYNYALMGGQWVVTSQVSDQSIRLPNEDYTNTRSTITYIRDSNGVITGMGQARTGERRITDSNTGLISRSTLQNYQAIYARASDGRWYIRQETYDWIPVE